MFRKYISKDSLLGEEKFQWRGGEVSRLESLVDGVFAIAVTLLIVSRDVPQSFQDFVNVMWTFSGFIITFTFLFMIWYAHYLFHRRYGLEDFKTVLLNSLLIFLILFYIYPLKFLATVLIGEVILNAIFNMNVDFGFQGEIFTFMNMRTIMLVYGAGVFMIWAIITMLYKHAYNHRNLLELNDFEIQTTKEYMLVYMIMSSFGLLSVILAYFLPLHWSPLAGWVYAAIGPTLYITMKIKKKRQNK